MIVTVAVRNKLAAQAIVHILRSNTMPFIGEGADRRPLILTLRVSRLDLGIVDDYEIHGMATAVGNNSGISIQELRLPGEVRDQIEQALMT